MLTRAVAIIGDAPVILKAIGEGVETEIKSLEVSIGSATSDTPATVTAVHAPVEPTKIEPATGTEPAPAVG